MMTESTEEKELTCTEEELRDWTRKAEVGRRLCYHEGRNLYDPKTKQKLPVARAAMELAVAGYLFLYQRRLSEFRFRFCARRVSKKAGKKLRPEPEYMEGVK